MKVLRRWKTRILIFFAVVGPGFITANVDNDAGGIWTYSSAGAQFGHALLWSLIPITIALIVVQEICARMGAVTGKGLSDLIREEFGLRITFFMMLGILIVNFGNIFCRIRRYCRQSRAVWPLQEHHGPALCRYCVAYCGEGTVQVCGEGFSCSFVFLFHLHFCWHSGQTSMEGCIDCHRRAPS